MTERGKLYIDEPGGLRAWQALLRFTRSDDYREIREYLEAIEKAAQERVKDVTSEKQQVFVAIGQWQALSGLLAVLDGAKEAVDRITDLLKQQQTTNNTGG